MNINDPLVKLVVKTVAPIAVREITAVAKKIKKSHDNRKAGIITLKKNQYSEGTVTLINS